MRNFLMIAVGGMAVWGMSATLVGCGDDSAQSGVGGGSTTSGQGGSSGGGEGGAPICGSANGMLDTSNLVQLTHDDGVAASNALEAGIAVTTSKEWVFSNETVHEAVRFALEHPARIHGFEVMWAAVPSGMAPDAELAAGLYADFGHNGFDFWAPEPLWTGTRCVQDVDDSGQAWTRYTFEEPVVMDKPGLVYVAHQALAGEPLWWFDGTVEDPGDNPCASFEKCQSAFNLPEADADSYYNGLSFPFQNHFMVRLYVEYTDDVQPADTLFQPLANGPEGSSHVSFVDYDKDGYDDLFLQGALWHNNGDGSFSDVTLPAGLDGLSATGGVWGDYDNDGCLDLFAFSESATLPSSLWHNGCDGTFSDTTATSTIADTQTSEACGTAGNTQVPSAAAAWVDLDADGFLDLYIANHICWSANPEKYYVDTVWKNNGDGTFTSLTGSQGFSGLKFPGRTVSPIDHDGDGDVDVLVGNYRLRSNLFFENLGGGVVKNMAVDFGLAGNKDSFGIANYYGHTIGTAWGDLDNDGDFDAIFANLAHPRFFGFSDKTQVLLNDGTGHYSDKAGEWMSPQNDAGLRYQETHSVPTLLDADNDGILDLVLSATYDGRPSDFYWGNGDGSFTRDNYHAGITTTNGWGMAAADFDNDGDVDLFSKGLFQNNTPATDLGHWLQVHVTGATANYAGIGATVRVKTGTTTRMRHVQGGTGKGGQDSLYLHFGVADATTVDEISVTFPGGNTVTFAGPHAVDQRVFVKEDYPSVISGWVSPF